MRNRSYFWTFVASLILVAVPVCRASQGHSKDLPKKVVAVVDGAEITEEDLKIQPQLAQLRDQEYKLKMRAVENAITRALVEKAAAAKNLTPEEFFKQEVESKVAEPTEAEIEGFYWGQKERFREPLPKARDQVVQALKRAKSQDARQALLQKLRQQATVRILVEPMRVNVATGKSPRKGPPGAPITIVEFSDYQCPNCKRVQGTLQQVSAKYKDQVSFVFKDFPLNSIHPQAQSAAEAAHCAGEQGKYWEYHDALFAAPTMTADTMLEAAKTVKLNLEAFKACTSAGKYKSVVDNNFAEGQRFGVSGTPAFFINGVLLSGDQPLAAFENAIENELAQLKNKTGR